MPDEEQPRLLGNSTDAFLKWRSGERLSSHPPVSFPFSLYHVSSLLRIFSHHQHLSGSLSELFPLVLLSSLSLSLAAVLSLFFLIRVTRCCCCSASANVTTTSQPDITDGNKLFPKIPSDAVVLLLRSPISWPGCGFSVSACVCVSVTVTRRQKLLYRL